MSGGVDSCAAALCLTEAGYEVCGATLVLCPGASAEDADVQDARAVCKALGIEHRTIDLREAFRGSVIADFAAEYAAGRTPNPCIVCNREIKFGKMLDYALENGFDAVATGHYAGIIKTEDGRFAVRRSQNGKDQSYVLWQLTQRQLAHIVLPLCDREKESLREKVRAAGLPVAVHAKLDSQDICFIPDGDYARFLTAELGVSGGEGCFVDADGHILGHHKGVFRYTVGQRKGLGGGFPEAMFVSELRAAAGEVVLAPASGMNRGTVDCIRVNMMQTRPTDEPFRAFVKLRYAAPQQPAFVTVSGDADAAVIAFDQPQRAPTPGQSAVFYDENGAIIGGGIIRSAR